jgi:hypothetical protein
MTTNRILTKGLLPALLLSTALAVPAPSVAAPAPHGKAHGVAKAKQNEKAERQAQKAQVQAQKAQAKAVKAQRNAAKSQRTVVVVPQRRVAQRVVVPQRRVAQRVVVPQQRVVVAPARPVYVARSQRAQRPWQGWNNRYSRYGSGIFQLEGTYIGPQYGCGLLQDPRGQVIPLLIDPKEFRKGDHVIMSGRIQNSSVCGTAFRPSNVESVNGGAHYYGNNDRYRGDQYYNNRYNSDGRRYSSDGRSIVSITGRLDDSGRCPVVRGDHGEYYDLVGDLQNFRPGDHAKVIGFLGVRSSCGGPAIDVQEID